MSTFLTTSKMDSALAARIARSVAGSRHTRQKRVTARTKTTLLRLVVAMAVVSVASTVLVARYRYQQEVRRMRAALLDTVHTQEATLSPEERSFMTRAEPWLQSLSTAYEGDVTSEETRSPKALDKTLARPSVYVRGPVSVFATSAGTSEAAAASTRDSFLLCLLDPPASRIEKVVLSKVRTAYTGGAATSQQARRLSDVAEGLQKLHVPWQQRLESARELRELERVKSELANVHVDETKRAAQAELLIAAMDEPGEAGPADLDGERPHHVRVAIVDLGASKILLRVRKRVDPNWLAASTRSTFASAVDGCALALDVRSDVSH